MWAEKLLTASYGVRIQFGRRRLEEVNENEKRDTNKVRESDSPSADYCKIQRSNINMMPSNASWRVT